MLEAAADVTKLDDLGGLESNHLLIAQEAGNVAALRHFLRLVELAPYLASNNAVRDLTRSAEAIVESDALVDFSKTLERATAFDGPAGLNAVAGLALLGVLSGNHNEALKKLQVLEARDKSGRLALHAAKMYSRMGLKQHTERQARRAYYSSDQTLEALYFLADHLEREGSPLEAATLYKEHDAKSPLPLKPYRYRFVVALANAGEQAAALGECNKILAKDDTYAATHRLRGEILSRLNQHKQAYASFKRALECSPTDIGVLHKYALAAAHAGIFDEAENVAKQVAALDSRRNALIDEVLHLVKDSNKRSSP